MSARIRAMLGAFLVVALALGDVAAPALAASAVKNPDTYTYLTISDSDSLDPAYSYDTASHLVILNVYEPLFQFEKASTEKLIPLAAAHPGHQLLDRLRLLVLGHLEVGLLQVDDLLPLLVGDDDVDPDEVDTAPEDRLLLLGVLLAGGPDLHQAEQEGQGKHSRRARDGHMCSASLR